MSTADQTTDSTDSSTTDSTDQTTDSTSTDDTRTGGDDATKDWKAAHDKLLADARKWEQRSKANAAAAKELETLRKQTMTDQEKAVAEAKAAARAEVLAEVGAERVETAIRAALAGRGVDPDALLDGLDRKRFIDESGQPDNTRINEWVGRLAPQQQSKPPTKDLGQGARQGATQPAQITSREQLKTMTPQQIEQARLEGRLNTLMGVTQ